MPMKFYTKEMELCYLKRYDGAR